MKTLPFKHSSTATIGVELEFQIINPRTFGLVAQARELLHNIEESVCNLQIKPEVAQSMIEINSAIHHSIKELSDELHMLRDFLAQQAKTTDILICGGGTHAFQRWRLQKTFPTERYKKIAKNFQFLSKRSPVFGQHIHVGCQSGDEAIYLTHAFARYIPQLIAICASSPFYHGIDSGFFSARSLVFSAFPLSGVMPYLLNWEEFSDYYYRMLNAGIAESMKDFYWDIRPKPEFGTIEIRVCDTPLTINKAIMVAAYVQALGLYLLEEKPLKISRNLYFLYGYNRFQASRYGFKGHIVDFETDQKELILDDILKTLIKIKPYAERLNNSAFLTLLEDDVMNQKTDAQRLRKIFERTGSLRSVVSEQCGIWTSEA